MSQSERDEGVDHERVRASRVLQCPVHEAAHLPSTSPQPPRQKSMSCHVMGLWQKPNCVSAEKEKAIWEWRRLTARRKCFNWLVEGLLGWQGPSDAVQRSTPSFMGFRPSLLSRAETVMVFKSLKNWHCTEGSTGQLVTHSLRRRTTTGCRDSVNGRSPAGQAVRNVRAMCDGPSARRVSGVEGTHKGGKLEALTAKRINFGGDGRVERLCLVANAIWNTKFGILETPSLSPEIVMRAI